MKDLDTMTVGERFSYETVDVEALRQHQPLPEWLKKNKRVRARVGWSEGFGDAEDLPPGHPSYFAITPQNWRGDVEGLRVIPDPDNLAFTWAEYNKENNYALEVSDKAAKNNRYYVVTPGERRKLWRPLPWNHQRMQVWEVDMYQWHSQYIGHDGKPFSHPMSAYMKRATKPQIDDRWRQEIIDEMLRDYEVTKAAEEAQIAQYAAQWATPERHQAVIKIRKYFPDYQPCLDLIENVRRSPVYPLIEPYRWYKRYASLQDLEDDPILAIGRKART